MPTPGEMTEAVSKALGVPEPTVRVYARHLREAGLLSKHGHGRGAAKMTARDFARLIIALLATDSPAKAAAAVRDFGAFETEGLGADREDEHQLTLGKLFDPALKGLHTLEDAIAAIVAGFYRNSALKRRGESSNNTPYVWLWKVWPNISVRVQETGLFVEIYVHGNQYAYRHQSERMFSLPDLDINKQRFERIKNDHFGVMNRWERGVRVTREISHVELAALADEILNSKTELK